MVDVIVIGGGPAGLSAALFTAKNGLETAVFDTDETWMHKAHLHNYLGVPAVDGSEFLEIARDQIAEFGAVRRQGEKVTGVARTEDGFTVTTKDGEYDGRYVVFATGAKRELPEQLGCALTDEGTVDVGIDMETSVEDAYATGATVRPQEWQAIISAGDGAAAALHILSKEKGEHFHDFDTPDAA